MIIQTRRAPVDTVRLNGGALTGGYRLYVFLCSAAQRCLALLIRVAVVGPLLAHAAAMPVTEEPASPSASAPVFSDTGQPVCFTVDHIDVAHAALFGQRWLSALLGQYRGRCLGMTKIRALHTSLTNRLLAQGWVTSRVLLQPQNISTGRLVFTVIPGRLSAFAIEEDDAQSGGPGVSSRVQAWMHAAFPVSPGEVINLRDLEQGYENISRLPGTDASVDLYPGDAPGMSRLHVTLKRGRPVDGWVTVQGERVDDRYASTVEGGVQAGNVLGYGDQWMLYGSANLNQVQTDFSRHAGVSVDWPLGYWLMRVSGTQQWYRSAVAGQLRRFSTAGYSRETQLALSRVLARSTVSRWTLTVLAGYDDIANWLDHSLIRVSSYMLKTQGIRLAMAHRFARSSVSASLLWEHGEAFGRAASIQTPTGPVSIGDNRYQRWLGQLSASYMLPHRVDVMATASAQYSDNTLYPVRTFSLLSAQRVAGYQPHAVSGNSGAHVGVSLGYRQAFFTRMLSLNMRAHVGLDAGWIPGRHNEPGFARAISARAGVSVSYQSVQAAIENAWALPGRATVPASEAFITRASLSMRF